MIDPAAATTPPAAPAEAPPAAHAAPWSGYAPMMFRFDESYAALKDHPGDLPLPLRLKYLPLDPQDQVYLSLGGEYRVRIDDYRAPDFGLHGQPDFDSVQQRAFVHGDLHLGSDIRVFVQLVDAAEHGRKPVTRPPDRTHLDLAQGFVDVSFGPEGRRWRLRLGRQEVAVGRYIAVRDATDVRRTFDGARLDGTAFGWSLTGLAARATKNQFEAFDDVPDRNDGIVLVTAEHASPWQGFKVDLAAFGRDNRLARYALGAGDEHRRTVGARIYGARDGWDADGQVSYQFGTFSPTGKPGLDIQAWGAAFEGGRTLSGSWRPRLAVRLDAAGGDDNPGDKRLGTFDLPYPNLSYLTDAALFAPRNVHDIQPFVAVTPAPWLTLTAGGQFLWRNSTGDAVYSPLNTPVIPPGGHGRYVATEPYVRFDLHITPLIELQGGAVKATPGEALKSFGGRRDLGFAYTSLAVRF